MRPFKMYDQENYKKEITAKMTSGRTLFSDNNKILFKIGILREEASMCHRQEL